MKSPGKAVSHIGLSYHSIARDVSKRAYRLEQVYGLQKGLNGFATDSDTVPEKYFCDPGCCSARWTTEESPRWVFYIKKHINCPERNVCEFSDGVI